MLLQEARDTLNRLSPDGLLGSWTSSRRQIPVQIASLEILIAIDISEISNSPDDKIKELIHNRIINTLQDKFIELRKRLH